MQAKHLVSLRSAGLIAACLLAVSGARAATAADAFPTIDSYIKISGQAAAITGNEAAFQKRVQQPQNGGVGIEDLHFTKDLANETTLTLDGRALTGAEDYLAKVNFTKNEVGSFEAGYKTFRTFYDGIGGFFPLNKQWNALNQEDLYVDRGQFWVEAKIARPNMPEIEFKFTDGTRTGKKDSLIWGDSDYTGLPNNTPPISQVRKMVPSYRKLDEHYQNFEATLAHSVGNTTYSVTFVHEKTDDNDTRYGDRFPGEIKPFPTPASTLLVPAASMNNQVIYSQTDGMVTSMKGLNGKTETSITDRLKLQTAFNYQDLDSTFTGDRPLLTSTPTAVGIFVAPSNNYLNLLGNSTVKVYTGSIGLEFRPTSDFLAKIAVRGEDRRTASTGGLTSVSASVNTTTGVVTVTNSNQQFFSRLKEKSTTPVLDLSYSGFKNLSLYFSGSKQFVTGDERYATPYSTPSPAASNLTNNAMDDDHGKYSLGFNWNQSSFLTLRGEVFKKDHANSYTGYDASLGDTFVLGYRFNGVKLTAVAKPNARLTFTTRYVYQKGTADVAGNQPTYPTYDSMDTKNHLLGETIDWNPNNQFYLQANANLVFNVINTIYPRAGTTAASGSNRAYDSNNIVQDARNNYVTASVLLGSVVTKTDDLQLRFTYYRANNSDAALAPYTMPYGAAAKEFTAILGVKHKFSDRMIGNARVGYYDAKNDTTGGNTNYHGPLAYLSFDYAL